MSDMCPWEQTVARQEEHVLLCTTDLIAAEIARSEKCVTA
jgi:hypothetical protein